MKKELRTILKYLGLFFGIILINIPDLKAQQDALYSMYMANPFVINPAVAGTFPYYQVRSNNRFQWAGFTDAPVTNTLSFFGPMKDQPMGIGGYIINDLAGAEMKTGLYGSYAYRYPITDEIKISGGISLGFLQYRIDGTKLDFKNYGNLSTEVVEDPLALGTESKFIPDAKIGFFLYATEFHVGLAITQLINNKLSFGTDPTGLSKLKSHFYLTSGYKYFINRDWAVEPTIILKGVSPAPLQLDGGVTGTYKNMVSMGISWRTQDAISILLSYEHDRRIIFGYAYDIGISDFRSYNNGSHEIMVAFKFDAIKSYR